MFVGAASALGARIVVACIGRLLVAPIVRLNVCIGVNLLHFFVFTFGRQTLMLEADFSVFFFSFFNTNATKIGSTRMIFGGGEK